jgi:hypothetical protein
MFAKWLKNTPFGIHEQFPNAIEERRKKLYPIQKEAPPSVLSRASHGIRTSLLM